jgi:fucose 4-O-acetylase-like acetyltransferase
MLLGVVYHTLVFRMMVGGGPPGPMPPGGASRYLQDWLHSFRMPLFFLISGFFGRMMLEKYGTAAYFRKRWARIGVPLVVGMFTFGPAYILTRDAVSSGPGGPGGPPRFGAAAGENADGEMPPPPPGFVPPPLVKFDEDGDGSLSADEWKKARAEMEQSFGRGGPPGGRAGGGGFGPPPGGPFGPAGGGLSTRFFGSSSRLFELHHLWFLWYLLIFVTLAPILTGGLARIVPARFVAKADGLGSRLIRSGLAPISLGLIATPALLIVPAMFGWYLGLPGTIFRAFPDFLLHLDPEMAFFGLFFLAGWWLHRERSALPSLAGAWPFNFALGLVAFGIAIWLSDTYGRRGPVAGLSSYRIAGYALYSISSVAMSFAFMGFFQKYLDRASPVGRYLADTALWVYLVHQPFVIVGLAALAGVPMPWWALTLAVFILAVSASLFLYEALVRPTVLARWFGPAAAARARSEEPAPSMAAVERQLERVGA